MLQQNECRIAGGCFQFDIATSHMTVKTEAILSSRTCLTGRSMLPTAITSSRDGCHTARKLLSHLPVKLLCVMHDFIDGNVRFEVSYMLNQNIYKLYAYRIDYKQHFLYVACSYFARSTS